MKECNKTTIDAYIEGINVYIFFSFVGILIIQLIKLIYTFDEDCFQAMTQGRELNHGTKVTVCMLHLLPILLKVIWGTIWGDSAILNIVS